LLLLLLLLLWGLPPLLLVLRVLWLPPLLLRLPRPLALSSQLQLRPALLVLLLVLLLLQPPLLLVVQQGSGTRQLCCHLPHLSLHPGQSAVAWLPAGSALPGASAQQDGPQGCGSATHQKRTRCVHC